MTDFTKESAPSHSPDTAEGTLMDSAGSLPPEATHWEGQAIVYGKPEAMGSKRAFNTPQGPRVVDNKSKQLRTFQEAMRESMRECKPDTPHTGPMTVWVNIWMARPKSHYGTGKNAAVLKATSPTQCTTKPDADKVLRAVLDCGTGIWWRDDAQVCYVTVVKKYADSEAGTVINAEWGWRA